MAGLTVTIPYKPRPLQRRFHDERTRFCVLLCHRRFGKTVAAVNDLVRQALRTERKDWRAAYAAPFYSQAKAVAWDYDDLVVYAALGGRLDHTIANLQLFAKFSEREFYVTAVGEGSALRALTGPDVMDLPLLESGTVSVFSANDCARGVIETGMLYSLDDEDLSNRTSRGVSNELVGKPARIAVEEGTLYVFYPLP